MKLFYRSSLLDSAASILYTQGHERSISADMEEDHRDSLFTARRLSLVSGLFVALLAATVFCAEEPEETSDFCAGLIGWGQGPAGEYHYAVPFYSHHRNQKEAYSLTLIYPLLSLRYQQEMAPDRTAFDGFAALPLLAWIGSAEWNYRNLSGYCSPYLGAGSLTWALDDLSTKTSNLSLLPWFPLLKDTLNLSLYSSTQAECTAGEASFINALSIPGLGISAYRHGKTGIEEDFRLLSIWDISLYRHVLDLPDQGAAPWKDGFTTRRVMKDAFSSHDLSGPDPMVQLATDLQKRIAQARSGNPKETTGFLDPMFVYQQHGEGMTGLGMEPLFFYDREEGFYLPFLLSTFSDDGFTFGVPAFRHLFPLIHGNSEGTYYGFLANLGTLHLQEDYQAFDLKLIFNWQHGEGQGLAWGLLPFFGRYYPGYDLNRDIRFVQFPGHMLSYWNLTNEMGWSVGWGMELLAPLVLSFRAAPDGTRAQNAYRSLSVGPYGLLYDSDWIPGIRSKTRAFLLFGFESNEEGFTFDFCGLPLLTL
ncbi:MAG: hypothetical protein KJ645_04870 [Planctomycetes bacterium]|nr:hypothetical protein [Planctomycetota bacterium]